MNKFEDVLVSRHGLANEELHVAWRAACCVQSCFKCIGIAVLVRYAVKRFAFQDILQNFANAPDLRSSFKGHDVAVSEIIGNRIHSKCALLLLQVGQHT